jgi:hypothetical protein
MAVGWFGLSARQQTVGYLVMSEDSAAVPTDYEREKWQTEVDFRRQELSIKEREQSRLAAEAERSRWWNPLFIAIVGATIAAIGSVTVSWWNGEDYPTNGTA